MTACFTVCGLAKAQQLLHFLLWLGLAHSSVRRRSERVLWIGDQVAKPSVLASPPLILLGFFRLQVLLEVFLLFNWRRCLPSALDQLV